MTDDYLDRKIRGMCTRPGCGRRASEDSLLCRGHRQEAKAARRRSDKRLRKERRRNKQCAFCGRKSKRYRCPPCKVKLAMRQSPKSSAADNSADNRTAIAERTRIDADGRSRYHGQGRRGQQPMAQLDEQDLDYAITALQKAKAGLAIARAPEHAELPRVQRKDAERAALSQADHGARFISEVLDRNRYDEQMPVTQRKSRG